MLRPYRELLSTPGVRVFSAAGFVARMPIAMMTLGIVLLVAGSTGRYGLAGALAATYALANALSSPLLARLIDRFGQHRVIPPAVLAHGICLVGFILAVSVGAPMWTWFVAAGVTGAASPPIGSLVRARWGHVVGPGPRLQTAYSLESVVDEVIFVVGPLLVTVLATRLDPRFALVTALVLLIAGSVVFVRHRSSEPPMTPRQDHVQASVLRTPGMGVVVVAMLFIGGVFGGVEISTVAFADHDGHPALAGPLLACYAFGSMVGGLAYGGRHWNSPLARRLVVGVAVMTATVAVLPFVRHAGLLATLLFVAGVGIAPTLISGLSLVEQIVPTGRVTEGLTWATTGLIVGLSIASWLAGQLIDEVGASPAYTVGVVSGAAALVACLAGYRLMHSAATSSVAAQGRN